MGYTHTTKAPQQHTNAPAVGKRGAERGEALEQRRRVEHGAGAAARQDGDDGEEVDRAADDVEARVLVAICLFVLFVSFFG